MTATPSPSHQKLPKSAAGSPSRGRTRALPPASSTCRGRRWERGGLCFLSEQPGSRSGPGAVPEPPARLCRGGCCGLGPKGARGSSSSGRAAGTELGPHVPLGAFPLMALREMKYSGGLRIWRRWKSKWKGKQAKNSLIWPWSANCHWDSG